LALVVIGTETRCGRPGERPITEREPVPIQRLDFKSFLLDEEFNGTLEDEEEERELFAIGTPPVGDVVEEEVVVAPPPLLLLEFPPPSLVDRGTHHKVIETLLIPSHLNVTNSLHGDTHAPPP
jgi:hypothetical protein